MGVAEEHPLTRDLVKVRRPHHIVDASLTLHLGIDAGILAPVIGKEE